MGTWADAQKNKAIDAWTGKTTYTLNAGVWVKLHLGDPGTAGTTNPAANTTRIQVATWNAASAGSATSSAAVLWTSVPNSETYSWVSFWDAVSAGNFLGRDDLPSAQAVVAGNNFQINSGDITIAI